MYIAYCNISQEFYLSCFQWIARESALNRPPSALLIPWNSGRMTVTNLYGTCLGFGGSLNWGVRHAESPVRSLWEKANLNWVWTWMAVYGGSFSVLAAYVVSTITAAAAEEFKIKV
jgi:hypothetical protein